MGGIFPYRTKYYCGATKITNASLVEYFQTKARGGEIRTNYSPREGISYSAMVISFPDGRDLFGTAKGDIIYHGVRTLSSARPEGYCLRGYVSIKGEKHKGFTTSTMVELPEGGLVNMSAILITPEKMEGNNASSNI